ncbi:YgaP family membrane protein [Sulfurospirillum arcachonense]|uniref:YgaP family membrane protein n=1 Tax=Sulfurospirillum arcachonense TaxID=57666 RepID=UPI000468B41D|nr:DUF2892 domain-containing protein [Sulfurospirillum arcachonense]
MKSNVGKIDRVVRVLVGLGLIAFAYLGQQPLAYIGVVPAITGLLGFCPAYCIFNVNTTCNKDGGCCTKQ